VEGIDRLLEELTVWSADQRAGEAARSRSVERSLRQQAAEEATFAGTLVDLAEARAAVVVQLGAGRSHRGAVAGVGRDFLVLRGDTGTVTLVALSAVTAVRPAGGGAGVATGHRRPPARTLVQFLDRLAEERPRVRLIAAGEPVVGELHAVGEDVLSIRVDGAPPATVYVPAGSVSEVSLG
jgi:hypothetical protein